MSLRDLAKQCAFIALRAGFRLTPLPATTRDRMRQRFLERHADKLPRGPRGQLTPRSARAHRPTARAGARAIGYMPESSVGLPAALPATLVAFYLPQFHTIPENDAWWGNGFTEWHNVTRALPQFEGHLQPRLPSELGFYDLRLNSVMRRQMQIARKHGIGAFCSYFYWFGGKTLLEAPLQQWLNDTLMELPLCLCWANESWTRRWDGRADDLLIAQQHTPEDDLAFIDHVARYMRDPRYLRVDGKPLLLVYRPSLMPDPAETARRWRRRCHEHGIGAIHLVYVQSFDRVDPSDIGFDAAVEFPPNNITLKPITGRQRLINPDFDGNVFDWRELARASMNQNEPGYPRYPGVNPAWDNEPRRSGRGRVFAHAAPRRYREWLCHAITTAQRRFPSQPLVFVNAWNEWAEGAVLEPDTRLGYAWLDATRQALRQTAGHTPDPDPRPCAVIHAWYPDVLGELITALRASDIDWRILITTAQEREAAVRKHILALNLDCELHTYPNHGRDILPFLHITNRLLDEGTQIILKLHTKRSTHRGDGDQWRREMIDRLLAPQRAGRIVAAFRDEPTLGLVAPEGHVQPLDYYWGANRDNVAYLTRCMGIPDADTERDSFIAGSMFWARPQALRPLLDAHLGEDEFDAESAQVDGTLAHAIERVFTLAAQAAGFRVDTAAELCNESQTNTAPYPYARRDMR